MDYTREPIIESVITAREGCKLVIRSSKGMSQEEYFIDAVELITFGSALFYRSLEKPKPFLLPVQDYEVVEVREPRMVLKNVGVDRQIKIVSEKKQPQPQPPKQEQLEVQDERQDDKQKRQKRSNRRRGKGPQDVELTEEAPPLVQKEEAPKASLAQAPIASPSALSALLAPPTTLISETLNRYRRDEAFKQAFYEKEEEESEPSPIASSALTNEEFDEGDRIIFRGHETAQEEFKPFAEEQDPFNIKEEAAIEPEDPYNLKEEYTNLPFDEPEDQI